MKSKLVFEFRHAFIFKIGFKAPSAGAFDHSSVLYINIDDNVSSSRRFFSSFA